MTRVDLPDGGWAELCAARKVPERKRQRYRREMFALSQMTVDLPAQNGNADVKDLSYAGPEVSDQMSAMERALILCFVREWSFGDISDDALADLPADAYDALRDECQRLREELFPDFGADVDPKALSSG